MAVLYRKYRSQTFAEVVGQGHIITTLKNQVVLGQVAHAYLFTGSRGVGKTSVARILAKAVNCEKSEIRPVLGEGGNPKSEIMAGDACGQCGVCKAVENGNFIDLLEIDAASNTGVDNVRDIIEHVKFSPSIGKYKVFIIDEVHMLSKGAFNALLKTLEEPPKHAIFILATTEIGKVPVTIVSRTQRFDFKRLSEQEIFAQLNNVLKQENKTLDQNVINLLSRHAEGSLRDGLSLLSKLLSLGDNMSLESASELLGITDVSLCEELVRLVSLGSAEQLPDFFEALSEKGIDFSAFNKDLLEYFRQVLIYKVTGQKENFTLGEEYLNGFLENANAFLSPLDVIYSIRLFLKSFKDLSFSPSPQIPLLLCSMEGAFRQKSLLKRPIDLNDKNNKKNDQQLDLAALEEKKTVEVLPEKQVNPSHSEILLEQSELEKNWPKIIARVKNINSPLANTLRGCKLLGVSSGRFILGAKFLFHKQSLENQKNQALILQSVESVLNKRAGFVVEVLKDETHETAENLSLSDALKIFGGELVE